MSTPEPQTLPPTELALTVRPLPAELLNRFDAFLLAADVKLAESQQTLNSVNSLEVDSEAAYITMGTILAAAKKRDKANENERLELTRPIDDFKQQFLDADRPVHQNYLQIFDVSTSKMSAYHARRQAEEKKRQLEAEAEIARQKAAQEAEARKLEERASKLKSPEKAEELMRQADVIRQVSAMTPDSVALAPSEPKGGASTSSEIHEVESIVDMSAYLRWLADHPEWHCVLDFKTIEHNRLAKQFHALGVPGLKFKTRIVYRSKAK